MYEYKLQKPLDPSARACAVVHTISSGSNRVYGESRCIAPCQNTARHKRYPYLSARAQQMRCVGYRHRRLRTGTTNNSVKDIPRIGTAVIEQPSQGERAAWSMQTNEYC